jgi:hypothetical protein
MESLQFSLGGCAARFVDVYEAGNFLDAVPMGTHHFQTARQPVSVNSNSLLSFNLLTLPSTPHHSQVLPTHMRTTSQPNNNPYSSTYPHCSRIYKIQPRSTTFRSTKLDIASGIARRLQRSYSIIHKIYMKKSFRSELSMITRLPTSNTSI